MARPCFYCSRKNFKALNYEKEAFQEMFGLSKAAWFKKNHNGSFGRFYSVPFAENWMEEAFAYTFNVLDSGELLNAEW